MQFTVYNLSVGNYLKYP